MSARLCETSAKTSSAQIDDLSVVKLVHGVDVETRGHLPVGSLGTIVFVHDEGEAYEVEFTEPFVAIVTLRRSEIEPTETGRGSVADAFGSLHRHR